MNSESPLNKPLVKNIDTLASGDDLTEQQAEQRLEKILDDPNNRFLTTIVTNYTYINDAATALDALAFAQRKISERLNRTLHVLAPTSHNENKVLEANPEHLLFLVEHIKHNQLIIGEGGDAWVVVDKNEIIDLPPEICYKIFKQEATPRGRNSVVAEHDLQSVIYDILEENQSLRIKAPRPFYALEVGAEKILAMEKLPARSIDDLLRGRGTLPHWINIEQFCNQLELVLQCLHTKNIYHRDMHLGNIMISQSQIDAGQPMGYLIDFGLSGYAYDPQFAYKKEVADMTFTYNQDSSIMKTVRSSLHGLRERSSLAGGI